ncbi:MAG: hypothetical protein ACYDA8_01415, partial [Deferrisomatales bacterium]
AAEPRCDAVNRELVLCRRCRRIVGCREPIEKCCERCTTHDCPLLPAREIPGGWCGTCPPRAWPGDLGPGGQEGGPGRAAAGIFFNGAPATR